MKNLQNFLTFTNRKFLNTNQSGINVTSQCTYILWPLWSIDADYAWGWGWGGVFPLKSFKKGVSSSLENVKKIMEAPLFWWPKNDFYSSHYHSQAMVTLWLYREVTVTDYLVICNYVIKRLLFYSLENLLLVAILRKIAIICACRIAF